MSKVAVSGYFDPLHIGHIELFEEAKALGDSLVVILNNDEQAKLKKGKPFMPQEERKKILEALKCVDKVFLSIDKDRTVCQSLVEVSPNIFANGGDRLKTGDGKFDIPEMEVCDKMFIKVVDGLGPKIQSSSELTEKENIRPWGKYDVISKTKRIIVLPNERLSLQYHKNRDEYWTVQTGAGTVTIEHESFVAEPGSTFHIPRLKTHRLAAGNKGIEILEMAFGEIEEDDIVRVEDDYGR